MSAIEKIKDFDIKLTHKLAICSNPDKNSPLYFLRHLLMVLEFGFHGVPWFIWLLYLYITNSTTTSNMKAIAFALIIDVFITFGVKAVIRRRRPVINKDDMIAIHGPDKFSFPSGHSSRAILMSNLVVALYSYSTRDVSYFVMVLWAYITCISRIMLARHHFIDVAVGMVNGYLIYLLTIFVFNAQFFTPLEPEL